MYRQDVDTLKVTKTPHYFFGVCPFLAKSATPHDSTSGGGGVRSRGRGSGLENIRRKTGPLPECNYGHASENTNKNNMKQGGMGGWLGAGGGNLCLPTSLN